MLTAPATIKKIANTLAQSLSKFHIKAPSRGHEQPHRRASNLLLAKKHASARQVIRRLMPWYLPRSTCLSASKSC